MHNTRNYVYDPEETYIVFFFFHVWTNTRISRWSRYPLRWPVVIIRQSETRSLELAVETRNARLVPGNRVQYSWKALSACTASRYFARKKPPELFRPILRYRLLPDERAEDR